MVTLPSTSVRINCTGTRKDGSPCGHMLGILTADGHVAGLSIKCERCGKVTELR